MGCKESNQTNKKLGYAAQPSFHLTVPLFVDNLLDILTWLLLKQEIVLKGHIYDPKIKDVLSCQPRVTVTSCFVYKVIRDL